MKETCKCGAECHPRTVNEGDTEIQTVYLCYKCGNVFSTYKEKTRE